MNQLNDQWVIAVAPGMRRMNGLVRRRIRRGSGRGWLWGVVWGVCRSDHSRNHSRDDERALGWSQHGEAFGGEEGMMAAVERGLIYAVAKMSRDLLWGL